MFAFYRKPYWLRAEFAAAALFGGAAIYALHLLAPFWLGYMNVVEPADLLGFVAFALGGLILLLSGMRASAQYRMPIPTSAGRPP